MGLRTRLSISARIALAVFTLAGVSVGAFAMYVAWQENPQGEFHDETGVHWFFWLSVGGFWFGVIAGIPWLLAVIAMLPDRR